MYRELWNWDKVKDRLRQLPGRLGFPKSEYLRFLGLRLSLKDGKLFDELRRVDYPEVEPAVYYVLHEYSKAEDVPETGELIPFKKLPGGIHYYGSFYNRVIIPLERTFGRDPELLLTAADPLGGTKFDLGDASVKIYALPRIPVIFAIWAGDEELSASANVLFDSSASNYVTAEEATILCEITLKRLKDMIEALK